MHKFILLAIFIGTLASCGTNNKVTTEQVSLVTKEISLSKEELYQKKASIDTLVRQQQDQILVLVKISGKDELVEVVGESWPKEVDITYNILKDALGKVVLISESPYSESGDWNINYKHYFDVNGYTYAFEREVKAFNTFCPKDEYLDEVTTEKMVKLYSPAHVLVDSTYKMTDEQNKDITKKKCQQEVNSEDQVLKNVNAYLLAKNMKIK